jgi:uncharacterized membrane protein YqjE
MTDIQLMFIALGFMSILTIVVLHTDPIYRKEVTIAYSIMLGLCSALFFYVALFS